MKIYKNKSHFFSKGGGCAAPVLDPPLVHTTAFLGKTLGQYPLAQLQVSITTTKSVAIDITVNLSLNTFYRIHATFWGTQNMFQHKKAINHNSDSWLHEVSSLLIVPSITRRPPKWNYLLVEIQRPVVSSVDQLFVSIAIPGLRTGILSHDTFFGKDKKFAEAGVGSKMSYIFFF